MYTTIIYLYYRVPSASPSNNNLTRLPPSLFPTRHLSPDLKVDRANFLRIMLKIGFLIRPLTMNSSFFFQFKVQDAQEVTTGSQERRSLAGKDVEPKEMRQDQDAQSAREQALDGRLRSPLSLERVLVGYIQLVIGVPL